MTLLGDIKKINTFLLFADTQLSCIRSGQHTQLTLPIIFEKLPDSLSVSIPPLSEALDMEQLLTLLSSFLEQKLTYIYDIGKALIYPAFICISVIISSLIYIVFVVPNLASMISKQSTTPVLISFLLYLHHSLSTNWDFLILLVCGLLITSIHLLQSSSKLLSIFFTSHRSDFYFLIGVMLQQGLSLNTVFTLINPTKNNPFFLQITHIKSTLFKTGSIHNSLNTAFDLTPIEHHYISKGESNGSLDKDLLKLSQRLTENHKQTQQKTIKKLHYYSLILLSLLISIMIYLTFIPITKSIEMAL